MCLKKLTLFAAFFLCLGSTVEAKSRKYVGVERCSTCHNDPPLAVVPRWSAGPHAKAFKTLQSPRALQIAGEMGVRKPTESLACLVCHSTAPNEKKPISGRGISMDEGVSCEACHGAGKRYAKFSVMTKIGMLKLRKPKDGVKEAKKYGLLLQGEQGCVRCHSKQIKYKGVTYPNPTYKALDIEAGLLKIRHWH